MDRCEEMLFIPLIILVLLSYTHGDTFQPVSSTCRYWDSLTRYTNGEKQKLHCILDDSGIEGIVNATWKLIAPGNCPIFNRHSEQVDSVPCDKNLGRCPDIDIVSYQAIQYNACYGKDTNDLGLVKKIPKEVHTYNYGDDNKLVWPLVVILTIVIVMVAIVLMMGRIRRKSTTLESRRNDGNEAGEEEAMMQQKQRKGYDNHVKANEIDVFLFGFTLDRLQKFFRENWDRSSHKALEQSELITLAKFLAGQYMTVCDRNKCSASRIATDTCENGGTSGLKNEKINTGDVVDLTFSFPAKAYPPTTPRMIDSDTV